MDQTNQMPVDLTAFREVVRHPQAHAVILGNYRIGEYAGVVALRRLLGEMQPEGKLHAAMEIHYRDEDRHSKLFTDWMQRIGVEPPPLPTEVEGYFANSPEEFQQQRKLVETLPPEMRRILVFAGINAIERLAYNQFENHLLCLDRREDIDALKSVMDEEKFHLSYVEHELDRQCKGEFGGFVTQALEQARAQFAIFQQTRRAQAAQAIERVLGGGA
ncbi:MAG TPA: ferritin-like domain-containing protein [Candidatus Eisenbacteria bacterium]|nr:ferritin-like domain-containing protein [Candidatus Eisenbacteria bacterium]